MILVKVVDGYGDIVWINLSSIAMISPGQRTNGVPTVAIYFSNGFHTDIRVEMEDLMSAIEIAAKRDGVLPQVPMNTDNPCAPQSGGIARCFKCGKEIVEQGDFRTLGSQGHPKHPEWILVYCETCMNPKGLKT